MTWSVITQSEAMTRETVKKMEKDKEKVFLQSILKESEPYREGIKVKGTPPPRWLCLK